MTTPLTIRLPGGLPGHMLSLEGHEGLSTPYRFTCVVLVGRAEARTGVLLGEEASVTLQSERGIARHLSGVMAEVGRKPHDAAHTPSSFAWFPASRSSIGACSRACSRGKAYPRSFAKCSPVWMSPSS